MRVVASKVEASQFFGHIAIAGFVFDDRKKHIPYHHVVFVEEFNEESPNLKKLPFIKEVADNQQINEYRSE